MKYRNSTTSQTNTTQSGFTIVELMIATAVFSLVLLVILYGVLSFTHAYYSGVNASATQNDARTIVNAIAQSVEFSGNTIIPSADVSGSTYYFCVGGNTYFYNVGSMYNGPSPSLGDPGLYMEPSICTKTPNYSDVKGKELLGANMRVTYLSLAQSSTNARLYDIAVGLAYGYGDLLCNNSKSGTGSTGGCYSSDPSYNQSSSVVGTNADDVVCKQITGSQFCAHAGLSTTVSLRVSNGALSP
jgi:prepilin-type N-terminal cleavage/methylation domain-containing protein